MAIVFDNEQGTLPYARQDSDGRKWVLATAHGTLTAKTPYAVYPYASGFKTAAISTANDAYVWRIGVPEAAAVTSAEVWMQIGGLVEDMVTASIDVDTADHYIDITSGVTADAGATFGANVFASIVADNEGAATTGDYVLLDREIITST